MCKGGPVQRTRIMWRHCMETFSPTQAFAKGICCHLWITFTIGQRCTYLMFLCCQTDLAVEQTAEQPVITETMTLIWHHISAMATNVDWMPNHNIEPRRVTVSVNDVIKRNPILPTPWWSNFISHTLSREYRLVRSRYSRLLFTCERRLCANLRMQKQSRNITSQCLYLGVAWSHRSTLLMSQC